MGCDGTLLGSTLATAVPALLAHATNEHFLPSVLFISEDACPRSHRVDSLLPTDSQERVRAIPNIVSGQEETETPMVGLGRLSLSVESGEGSKLTRVMGYSGNRV